MKRTLRVVIPKRRSPKYRKATSFRFIPKRMQSKSQIAQKMVSAILALSVCERRISSEKRRRVAERAKRFLMRE